jgi:hypothetical protein
MERISSATFASSQRLAMQEILMAEQNVRQLLDYRNAEHGRANDRHVR